LAVTGVRRTSAGPVEAVFVGRCDEHGVLTPAGSIELGLTAELVELLEEHLASLTPRRTGATAWYPPEVSVTVSLHGLPDGPARDAVLRRVMARDGEETLVPAQLA
jgi:hypothetical protein